MWPVENCNYTILVLRHWNCQFHCNYTILVLKHWNCQFHFMPQKSLHQSDARPHTTRVYSYSSAAENGCHALVVKINGFESHRARLQRTERRPKTTNSSGRSSTSLTVWGERHSTGHSLVHYHNNDMSSAIRHQCQCLVKEGIAFLSTYVSIVFEIAILLFLLLHKIYFPGMWEFVNFIMTDLSLWYWIQRLFLD